jgi:hypothetical protein
MAERATPAAPRKRAPRKAVDDKVPSLVLTGPPHAVRGRISLANTGTERLVIRGAFIHLPKRDPIPVPLTALIGPGATTDAVVSADLGGNWPAGTVHGELEVSGQRRDVEVRVVQTIGLDITPGDVMVSAGATPISIIVRNFGNVAVPLARVSRGHLMAHDGGDPSDDSPDATLRLARAVTIAPGAELAMQVSVEIPKGLPPDRRHRAHLPIGPADLVVTVLPTDPPAASAGKARTRTTTRKEP